MTTPTPRGINNANPGNLRYNTTDKWQGLATPPSDGTFFVFVSATYGIRAMARNLISFQDKENCKTVTDFITRWAPPSENNTASYIDFVANYMEVTATTPINVHEYNYIRPMIEAMIQRENGAIWSSYYTSDILDKALVLAGVEPVKKSLVTAPQIIGGTVAAVATISPSILDQINQMHNILLPYASSMPIIHTVCTFLALAAVGYSMYAKYNERQNGIS
jgi:hypothetical protein